MYTVQSDSVGGFSGVRDVLVQVVLLSCVVKLCCVADEAENPAISYRYRCMTALNHSPYN